MPRILLIAATTGYQTRAFADAARRLGIEVTLATDRCHVLEDPWRDRAIAVRFEEPDESAQAITASESMAPDGKARPDGIVAVADRSTPLAALTAQRFGLPWHPPEAVALCRNKHRMREAFAAAGLPAPRHFMVPAESDPAAAARRAAFPCVLKPLGLSASRGVIRANNAAEFGEAFRRIGGILKTTESDRAIQIETYIPGKEFALEGIMTSGQLRVLALFDKPDPLEGPFFEETIYVTPSRESAETQRAIVETCRKAVDALGLRHGPIHAEMRVNADGVFMLEIAARPIGGLCARVLRWQSGTLEDLIVLHAVGAMPETLEPAAAASAVMMIPAPGAGILEAVHGVEAARATPLVTEVEITAKLGEKIVPLPEGAAYPGFLFAEGPDPGSVETALRRAHAELRFRLLSALPVLEPRTGPTPPQTPG